MPLYPLSLQREFKIPNLHKRNESHIVPGGFVLAHINPSHIEKVLQSKATPVLSLVFTPFDRRQRNTVDAVRMLYGGETNSTNIPRVPIIGTLCDISHNPGYEMSGDYIADVVGRLCLASHELGIPEFNGVNDLYTGEYYGCIAGQVENETLLKSNRN